MHPGRQDSTRGGKVGEGLNDWAWHGDHGQGAQRWHSDQAQQLDQRPEHRVAVGQEGRGARSGEEVSADHDEIRAQARPWYRTCP